jgi:integrase
MMRLRDIGVEDVDGYINVRIDDKELSDKTVNNHVTLLSTMLRTATTFKVPWLLGVPKFRKPKVALFSLHFQWLRSDDDVRRFLAVARDEDEHVVVFYATAIYTGCRAGELAALEWPDIDFDRRLITVQRGSQSLAANLAIVDRQIVEPNNDRGRGRLVKYRPESDIRIVRHQGSSIPRERELGHLFAIAEEPEALESDVDHPFGAMPRGVEDPVIRRLSATFVARNVEQPLMRSTRVYDRIHDPIFGRPFQRGERDV